MKNRIYLKDWLEIKPYDKPSITDTYYLKICNEVKDAIFSQKQSPDLLAYLNNTEINYLACFLTSYFEDLISETNIWNSFVRIHQRLYSKPLPFYDVDDYFEEEINTQDISVLIWYFINAIQDEKLVSPHLHSIAIAAEQVMAVFENSWEYAPENKHLNSIYQIDENEDDFYVARNFIEVILYRTYLFHPDTQLRMKNEELNILDENKEDENLMVILTESRDNALNKIHSRLLNMQGKEWAAEILGNQHGLSRHFSSISKRISGLFLYKGQDEVDVFIEHIASGRNFKLTKKSFDYYETLKEVDVILYMSIVRWKDEWWFSGIYFEQPFNPDVILDEKNSAQSRKQVDFLNYKNPKIKEILNDQFDSFKALSGGSQIVFLSADGIEDFLQSYHKFYNDSLNLSEKQREESRKRARKEGFFGTEKKSIDYTAKSPSGLVFFNPKSGVEIAMGVNCAFPLPNNPFFNIQHSEEDVMLLLTSNEMSSELAMFCINNCKEDLPFFTAGAGKAFLRDIDFLLRFLKTDSYFAEPSITLVGQIE